MMSSTTSLPSRQEEEASTSTKGTNPSLLPASSYTAHNSNKPLSITLNGNKLALSSKGRWELESSDLDVAVLEIERLLHDKEQLSKALAQSVQQVEDLSQEIREINQMKSVVLEMVRYLSIVHFTHVSLSH